VSIRDLVAPHRGRHTSRAVALRLVEGRKETRTARPTRACEGSCPCHADQTTQENTR
jgi:hypothetical protein